MSKTKVKIVVDVESDGPLIGHNSMVCFGAVVCDADGKFDETFYGQTSPISHNYNEQSLAISGFSRKEHEQFSSPEKTMKEFSLWVDSVKQNKRPIFVSDNNGYDFAWMNYYMLKYAGINQFGWSSRNLHDMFIGYMNDPYYKWRKKHRKTKHTHDPVDDAKGNAEALLWLVNDGFNMSLSQNGDTK